MNCVQQTSLGDQGRTARGGGSAGAGRHADHLRCAGRRPLGHRLRPDVAGCEHAARSPRCACALSHRRSACGSRASRGSSLGDAEAGQSVLCKSRDASDRHAAGLARSRRRKGARLRVYAVDSGRRAGGRGARCRAPDERNCAADRDPRSTVSKTLRDPIGRRDHSDGQRERARRAECRVPARARDRSRRVARNLRDRRRHRWRRWRGGRDGIPVFIPLL